MKVGAKIAIALAVVVVLALPAGAGEGGSKVPSACRLLKVTEIQEQFGPEVGSPKKGVGTSCNWPVGGEARAPGSGVVSTLVYRGPSATTAYESGKVSYPDAAPVEGIGRQAFFAPGLGVLWVLKNKKASFYVQGVFIGDGLTNTGVADLQPKLEALAEIALKRT